MIENYLTIDQVMAQTHYSRPSIYRMIKEGRFPAQIRLRRGNKTLWRQKDIEQWMDFETGGEPACVPLEELM